jgi:hypothetical protein
MKPIVLLMKTASTQLSYKVPSMVIVEESMAKMFTKSKYEN